MYFFDDFLFWRLPPLLHAMMVLEDTPGPHPVPLMPAEVTRQSHPQGSRRPEDNHTEMASLACGTAAGDPHKSPPANPAGHSVPRVCVAGGNGPEAPG